MSFHRVVQGGPGQRPVFFQLLFQPAHDFAVCATQFVQHLAIVAGEQIPPVRVLKISYSSLDQLDGIIQKLMR